MQIAQPTQAKIVKEIDALSLDTGYTYYPKDPGNSTLTIDIDTPITVTYTDNSHHQFNNGHFLLNWLTFDEDQSTQDMAIGLFKGGSVVFSDE